MNKTKTKTICRFIQHPKFYPRIRLSIVLPGSTASRSPTGALDGMYTQLLRHSVIGDCEDEDKEELLERFRHVVGSIVLLSDPLTASSLAKLLHKDPWEVDVTLNSLGSVLDISESQGCGIRSLHPSFCDFLLDQKRCLDLEFWINEQKTHGDLFLSCLKLMSKYLRRDMCRSSPFTEAVPPRST